jgi:hypothetical protein
MRIRKTIIHEEDIIIGNNDYTLVTYEDNTQALRKYDEKTKMWLTVKFVSKEESDPDIEEAIIDILSKSYLEGIINKVEP